MEIIPRREKVDDASSICGSWGSMAVAYYKIDWR